MERHPFLWEKDGRVNFRAAVTIDIELESELNDRYSSNLEFARFLGYTDQEKSLKVK